MPRALKRVRKRREEITSQELMILLKGYCWNQSEFKSDEDAYSKWKMIRDEIMTFWLQDPQLGVNPAHFTYPEGWNIWNAGRPGGPGTRPWGWWKFSAPETRPEGESQREYLERHGLLTDDEQYWLSRHKEN